MRIGDYEVLEQLGAGGMAQAYSARAPDGSVVVLKIPHENLRNAQGRLIDEARVGMRIRHPCLVRTLDVVHANGKAVLVLEHIQGRTLAELIGEGPLSPALIVRIGRQISEALHALHTATNADGRPLHILHRDITPPNIMVSPSGDAKLIDLGIARGDMDRFDKTQTGSFKGTLRFLAPELLDGAEYTPASDLWSLGIVLFEAALSRRTVKGGPAAVFPAILYGRNLELQPGEAFDPYVDAALACLLCPVERRMPTAAGAVALFAGLEDRLGPPVVEAGPAVDVLRAPTVRMAQPADLVATLPMEVAGVEKSPSRQVNIAEFRERLSSSDLDVTIPMPPRPED